MIQEPDDAKKQKDAAKLALPMDVYEPHAVLHFCSWLQSTLSLHFCLEFVEWQADKEQLEQYFEAHSQFETNFKPKIEELWTRLTPDLRKRISATTLSEYRFRAQKENLVSWHQSVEHTLQQMRRYNTLSTEVKNKMFDQYFPEKNIRSKPPEFPLHLHLFRTQFQSTAFVINSMSWNHWGAWARMLNAISKDETSPSSS